MDIDTYIPIKIGSLFGRSKFYLDIVDPISQTKFRHAYFNVIFDYIEYFILKIVIMLFFLVSQELNIIMTRLMLI